MVSYSCKTTLDAINKIVRDNENDDRFQKNIKDVNDYVEKHKGDKDFGLYDVRFNYLKEDDFIVYRGQLLDIAKHQGGAE